jgi:hypothetical protein
VGSKPPDEPPGNIPQDRKWEDSASDVRIQLGELQSHKRLQRKDIRKLEEITGAHATQLGVLTERVDHFGRILWWGLGIVATLVTGGWVTVLAVLLRR